MRAVVQRALSARVEVEGEVIGRIDRGLVVFVGASEHDERADIDYTVNKVVNLRVFPDERGRMTKALGEVGGALLVISQFTVFGDVRRERAWRRASFARTCGCLSRTTGR